MQPYPLTMYYVKQLEKINNSSVLPVAELV